MFYWRYYLILFFKFTLTLNLQKRFQKNLISKNTKKQLKFAELFKNTFTRLMSNGLSKANCLVTTQNLTSLTSLITNLTLKQNFIYFTGCSELIMDFFNFYSLFFSTTKLLKYSWLLKLDLFSSNSTWISFCLKQLKQLNFLIIFSLTDLTKTKKLNVAVLKNDYLLIGLTKKIYNPHYVLNLHVTELTLFQKYLYFWAIWMLILNLMKFKLTTIKPLKRVVNIQHLIK